MGRLKTETLGRVSAVTGRAELLRWPQREPRPLPRAGAATPMPTAPAVSSRSSLLATASLAKCIPTPSRFPHSLSSKSKVWKGPGDRQKPPHAPSRCKQPGKAGLHDMELFKKCYVLKPSIHIALMKIKRIFLRKAFVILK